MAPITPTAADLSRAEEEAAIARITADLKDVIEKLYPPGTRMRRDAHPKAHGVVTARFSIGSNVPEALRHGLFATPKEYTAWVRFSNSAPQIQHDLKPDVRGFAIKLLGVAGEKLLDDERDAQTHDFILASAPMFFVRNPLEYVPFSDAVKSNHPFSGFFFKGGLRGAETEALLKSAIRIKNPLAIPYWSQVPYRLGPNVVKYHVQPRSPLAGGWYGFNKDYLRANMAAALRRQSVTFDFMIQRQVDTLAMPIEDPVIRWDEAKSPFVTVATLTIPRQLFDSPEQMTAADNLSYTPWHALPEHEPLGGINRIRKTVYREISTLRHRTNGVERKEPAPDAVLPGSVLL